MKNTNCLICSAESTFLFSDIYHNALPEGGITFNCNFYQCKECRTVFIYPQPDARVISSSYNTDYDCYNESDELREQRYSNIKLILAKSRYVPIRSFSSLLLKISSILSEIVLGKKVTYTLGFPLVCKKNAEILEVGYGTGYWLKMMSNLGFTNLSGFDISDNISNAEQLKKSGLNIQVGTSFEDIVWDRKFDLIRLEHVFEHVINPVEIAKQLHFVLSSKGTLVMTMPTIDSLVKTSGFLKSSYDLDIPRHLFHFSAKSIKIALLNSGFVHVKVKTIPVFRNFVWNIFLRYGINTTLLDKATIKVLLITFAPIYYIVCGVLKKGEFLSVYAEKE